MTIKSGAYSVKSGYKIYDYFDYDSYDRGVVYMSGNGSAQEFIFFEDAVSAASAATLFAGVTMLSASLFF